MQNVDKVNLEKFPEIASPQVAVTCSHEPWRKVPKVNY